MSLSAGMIGVTLAGKLASMMLYVLLGFIITRIGLLKVSDSKVLSTLVIWVLQPAMIFNSFQLKLTAERWNGFLAAVSFSLIVFITWIILTFFIRKPLRLTPTEQATLIYSNCGNLILPLVSMMLGIEFVFYGAATQVAFHLFMWTHGISLIRGERSFNLKMIYKNSNIIAVVVSFIFLGLHIPVPEILDTSITGLSQMVGPASMLVIGMALAEADLKAVFSSGRAYFISFGRLVVYPLVIIGLLFITGFLKNYPEFAPALMVPIMSFSAPPASTVSQLAILYDKHPVEASTFNMMGTLLCIVTMPLIIQLYQILFL